DACAWCPVSKSAAGSRNACAGGSRSLKNSNGQTFVQKLLVEPGCRVSQRRDDSFSKRSAMAARSQFAPKDGPEPHRPVCRQPGAYAPQDAWNEPGKAGWSTRPHLPAGAEIREGRQPHRGEPVATNLPCPSGASRVLLRGRAERVSATRL